MASITVRTSDGEDKYFPLGKATVVVGRGEQVKVQILDDHVSEKHMQIRCEGAASAYFALDMKSKNGTRVNGRNITADLKLEDGDLIEIGQSSITFHDREFPDKTDAFKHHKQPGERGRSTLMQKE